MAQTTILATGTTEATSTDVVVAAGSSVTVGIYLASGELSATDYAIIYADTPGVDLYITSLSKHQPIVQLYGPATYRVKRSASTTSLGVFLES